MLFKDAKFRLKEIGEEGSFSGYAAVFNNTDLGGDIIAPGAFAKTIAENPKVPVLWSHNTSEVIGISKDMREDSVGLRVSGQLILDVQRAKEARSLVKEGAVKGLSIGYDPVTVDYSRRDEGIRILKEVKLWEYSLVSFPMNPEAQVTDVKGADDLETKLHQIISFAENHKGKLSAEQGALVKKTIGWLNALQNGTAFDPNFDQGDAGRAMAKCEEILGYYRRL
jgi:HK97 family phage prohead protease